MSHAACAYCCCCSSPCIACPQGQAAPLASCMLCHAPEAPLHSVGRCTYPAHLPAPPSLQTEQTLLRQQWVVPYTPCLAVNGCHERPCTSTLRVVQHTLSGHAASPRHTPTHPNVAPTYWHGQRATLLTPPCQPCAHRLLIKLFQSLPEDESAAASVTVHTCLQLHTILFPPHSSALTAPCMASVPVC